MSYRNDHDAAIARVDALERELEQMAGEYEKTRTELAIRPAVPRRSRAGAVWAIGLAVFAVGAGFSGALLMKSDHETPTEPAVVHAAPSVAAVPSDLSSCLAGVEASTNVATELDAKATDPRGLQRRSVDAVESLVAGCRPELARASTSLQLDDATRTALKEWARREDELAGAASRLLVYYGSDPYAINNYATAGQVWRELDAARASRDTLIANEGKTLHRAVSAL